MQPREVDPASGFRYVDQQLIVRTSELAAVAAHFGIAPDALDTLYGLSLLQSPKLAAAYGRLGELPLAQSAAVAPNYVLQPWVSSGGSGWPEPSDALVPAAAVGPPGVPVAVFDSGLVSGYAEGHPELANVRPGTEGDADLVPDRGNDLLRLFDCHGMFVAGVIGCAAPDATVRVVRAFDDDGRTSDWLLAKAVDDYLAGHPEIRLVNLSCSTFADPAHPPLALYEVVRRYPDVLFVAAAGNLPSTAAPAPHNAAPHTGNGRPVNAAAAPTWSGPARGRRPGTRLPRAAAARLAVAEVAGDVLVEGTSSVVLPAYPAAFDTVIGVGSALPNGDPAPFTDVISSDVYARGVDVRNAFGHGFVAEPDLRPDPVGPFDGTATWRGTSFAAPLATGLLTEFCAKRTGAPGPFSLIANEAMDWLRRRYGNPADPSQRILLPYPS
jgi:Subtilase family